MQALDITTTRNLEDLCINAIYANLLTGKLSPRTQTFQITSCTSRDLSPTTHDYPGMIATLTQWSKQCDLVLAEIAGRIRDVRASAADRKTADDEYNQSLEKVQQSISGNKKSSKTSSKSFSSGTGGQVIMEDVDIELMQDVEEHELISPRSGLSAGGESPSGRKRKLVRPLF